MSAPSDGWAPPYLYADQMETLDRQRPIKRRSRHRARRQPVVLAAVLAMTIPIVACDAAGAENITDIKAKAQEIAAQLTLDNARLGQTSSVYLAQSAAYATANAEAIGTLHKIRIDSRLVERDRKRIQSALVNAYVAGGSRFSSVLTWSSNPNAQISSSTYLGVATDLLAESVAHYQTSERTLKFTLVREQQATTAAEVASTASAAARDQVLATLRTEQSLYSSTNSQLNALVAAAAAAAAAVAAAKARTAAGPPAAVALVSVNTAAAPPKTVADAFAAIRNCESSSDYSLNTGNGYFGAYQFALATWLGLGETGLPSSAAPATQDDAAYQLYQRSGHTFGAWGTCAAITGVG